MRFHTTVLLLYMLRPKRGQATVSDNVDGSLTINEHTIATKL